MKLQSRLVLEVCDLTCPGCFLISEQLFETQTIVLLTLRLFRRRICLFLQSALQRRDHVFMGS